MLKQLCLLSSLLLGVYVNIKAQHQQVDVQHYRIQLSALGADNKIYASNDVTVLFLDNTPVLRLDLMGPERNDTGMTVKDVYELVGNSAAGTAPKPHKKQRVAFMQDSAGLYITVNAKKGETRSYSVEYTGIPRDGMIISKNRYGNRTLFTDHWPNRASYWLPCIDHPSDKATVTIDVVAPEMYTVVANGVMLDEKARGGLKITRYAEKEPIPTKVIAIGAAVFAVDTLTQVGGVPLYSYVFPENKEQGFRDYGRAEDILRFFTQHIGPFPYEKLANIQSKTIYGGMENASAIFYSEESVGSSHVESLIAHEIAHQWFGDAVTEKNWEHVWLSEGFATYMAHLYMESRYGTDTLRAGLKADRKKVIAFEQKRFTAIVDTSAQGEYTQLLNANSYQKGGWVLHMLRRQLGDSTFWRGIRLYAATYKGRNASTADFREVMEKVSRRELGEFFQQWLYTPGMPELNIRQGSEHGTFIIEQKQAKLYSFPLEYTIDNDPIIRKVLVKDKITTVNIQAHHTINIDPQINLLFKFSER